MNSKQKVSDRGYKRDGVRNNKWILRWRKGQKSDKKERGKGDRKNKS